MTDQPTEELSEDARAAVPVAQSLLSVMAALYDPNLHTLPAMGDGPGIDVVPLANAVDTIASTQFLSNPVKLELLDQLAKAPQRPPNLIALATALIREDAPSRDQRAQELLARVGRDRVPGRDALNRRPNDLVPIDQIAHGNIDENLFFALQPELQTLSVTFEVPRCHADRVQIGNRVALSIATEGWSTRPLADFAALADPLQWPHCPLQHTFFRSMTRIPPPPTPDPATVVAPDAGYSDILDEVVDFSFGWGFWRMETELKVVYFDGADRVGCTYDFHRSVDNRISIDQGFILAEQITPAQCRITTLKQVRFTILNLPPGVVCPIWGKTTALLAWACLPNHP